MRRSSNYELRALVLEAWRRTDASAPSGLTAQPDTDWIGARLARLANIAAALHMARALPEGAARLASRCGPTPRCGDTP
jgi:hypothetical protein